MTRFTKSYTDEQERRCIELFNRTELRQNEDVIDNSDKQIAKEVGIATSVVASIITKHLNKKHGK